MATASSDSLQARKPGRGGSGRRLRTDKEARKPLSRFHDARSVCGLRGGALATHVAQHRRVKHLILTGPNIITAATDKDVIAKLAL